MDRKIEIKEQTLKRSQYFDVTTSLHQPVTVESAYNAVQQQTEKRSPYFERQEEIWNIPNKQDVHQQVWNITFYGTKVADHKMLLTT
jgi:hypothetical protein